MMDQALPLQNLWVLLVEDEPAVAEVLTLALENAGAQVIAVSSAAQALKTLDAFAPNVLISDIYLSDINAWSLLASVRALEAERGIHRIPAIALTGHDLTRLRQENQTQTGAAQFQKYLAKPVELANLISTVAELGQPQEV
ncbi:response regulator [Trichocoleus sp. FACHB-591]|uniref:response regulator n=1 Tax=Trichocoleus sp. FACHB-591 TaxID=2692872 RepID=UPI0016878D04|nr:response regulator [Trichocoleus sp. FACHB-591]MBD2096349.1 response regulator [Trichocoleus sp. FACHB-591]